MIALEWHLSKYLSYHKSLKYDSHLSCLQILEEHDLISNRGVIYYQHASSVRSTIQLLVIRLENFLNSSDLL
jgi:hypothetical protein